MMALILLRNENVSCLHEYYHKPSHLHKYHLILVFQEIKTRLMVGIENPNWEANNFNFSKCKLEWFREHK